MDVFEAIATRHSIRSYSDRPVEEEKLRLILEAARLSPSAANSQDWHFVVVRDKDKIQKLMEAAGGQPFVAEAPCVLVACGKNRRVMDCGQPTDTINCAIAMAYMILEAHALGLGTCWLGRFNAERVREVLGIPAEVSVVTMSPLGYAAEPPVLKPRKELEDIVSYDRY
jgi:nitroreductase